MPLIGNPQAGFPSPIFVFTSIFGVIAGLKIAVWFHTFLGLWGMWLVSGYLGIRGAARLAPSLIFMFTGSWVLHISEGHITWLPAAFLPFLFLAFIKGLEDNRWLIAAAVFESFMIYEGGTYVLSNTVLFIGAYSVCYSIEKRSWKPIRAFIVVNVLSAAYSAPKLLPVLELLHGNPRVTEAGGAISWDNYLGAFLERGLTLAPGIVEYSSYLGFVVVVLYLFSLVRINNKSLALASLFMLLLTLGNFARFSPWNIVHGLPFFESSHNPGRALIIFCFSAALLVGIYLGTMGREDNVLAKIVVGLLVLYIGYDLFSTCSPVFNEARKPVWFTALRFDAPMRLPHAPTLYHVPPSSSTGLFHSVASVHREFHQVRVPDLDRFAHGAWSDQYLPVLRNTGVIDAYEPVQSRHYASAVTDKDYKGESYLLGQGRSSLERWSPNQLTFHVGLAGKGRLVINQNYWPGWHSSAGIMTNHNGLLAVDLFPGVYDINVFYSPDSFRYGMFIFLIAVGGSIGSYFVIGKNHNQPPNLQEYFA